MRNTICFLFVIVAIGLIIYSLKKKKTVSNKMEGTQEKTENMSSDFYRVLTDVNLRIRISQIDSEIKSMIEGVIDRLIEVMPEIQKKDCNSESIFLIHRIATNYLPEIVSGYLLLSAEDRKEKSHKLCEAITTISDKINMINYDVNSVDRDIFENEVAFLKQRLNDN